MEMDDLRTRLVEYIAREINIPAESIVDDVPLRELGVDSLGAILIVAWLEETLHLTIPEAIISRVSTIRQILTAVATELAAARL